MSESKEVILEAKHVTRRFRTTDGRTLLANNDVNLKFYKGETLGLVGESGCGKSTFMKFLVSLDIPSEGEILYPDTVRFVRNGYRSTLPEVPVPGRLSRP